MYDEIVNRALQRVIGDFRTGKIRLDSEGDLRGHLFLRSAEALIERRHPAPLPVHAEVRIGRAKVDLAVGPRSETVVEMKFEPFRTDEGVLFLKGPSHSIQNDMKKIEAYSRRGHSGHLIVVECEGKHPEGDWYFPKRTPRIGIPTSEWCVEGKFVWVHHVIPPRRTT